MLTLDAAATAGAGFAGGKATMLSRARALGLPVLPGVVVPSPYGREALARGAEALAVGGSGAARLAVMQAPVDDALLEDLARASRGMAERLIVRSSSVLEAGAAFAGAFSTFEDVGVDELPVALRGVWASAFTVEALRRFEMAGVAPTDAALAVLVQPYVRANAGGTARVRPGGAVQVNATKGPLSDLVGGWEVGGTATVSPCGEVSGDVIGDLGEALLLEVATTARRSQDLLGCDVIEWAWACQGVVLLQATVATAGRAAAPRPAHVPMPRGRALTLALAAARYAGPLGEEVVLPWAAALDRLPVVGPATPSKAPAQDLRRAAEYAGALSREVWQRRDTSVEAEIVAALRRILTLGPEHIEAELGLLRPVHDDRPRRILELLESVAAAAASKGLVACPRELWRYPPSSALRLLSATEVAVERNAAGPGRWEPFVFAVVTATASDGQTVAGIPAVGGVAAGVGVVASDPHDPPPLCARDILVVERPLPGFAPLLWRAAGLVTTGGNPGAHLLEVAHSLAVPSAVQVPLNEAGFDLHHPGPATAVVLAVDGDRGTVTVAPG